MVVVVVMVAVVVVVVWVRAPASTAPEDRLRGGGHTGTPTRTRLERRQSRRVGGRRGAGVVEGAGRMHGRPGPRPVGEEVGVVAVVAVEPATGVEGMLLVLAEVVGAVGRREQQRRPCSSSSSSSRQDRRPWTACPTENGASCPRTPR